MKRTILASFTFISVFLSACTIETEPSSSYSNPTVSMSQTSEWEFSDDNDISILDESVKNISISGDLSGKSLYCATVNTSSSDISSSYVKYCSQSAASRNVLSSEEQSSVLQESLFENFASFSYSNEFTWKPDLTNLTASARTISKPVVTKNEPVEQLTLETDVTKKELYVLLSSGEKTYTQKTATLRSYNDICNVWVVDDYYTTGSDGNGKVSSSTVLKFATAFKKIYPVIRNIFGNESDKIYYSYDYYTGFSTVPMNYLSDTGTKVNIVIYDLYGDGSETQESGTLGFFNPMDYYPSSDDLKTIMGWSTDGGLNSHSNEGKYFYIDSYFAKSQSDMIISTLAHEFQHMIHHGVKSMNNIDTDTNFNEMLSMLCEDMMQQFLDTNGYTLTDSNSPKGRLQRFVINYFISGIRNYNSSEKYVSISYANAYAFGAWLCRQYGGAALVQEMMSNRKANNDCIIAAVNSLNNTSFTFNEIFGQFIKACYGKDSEYTFNQNAKQTVSYSGYSYPMTKINLWEKGSLYDMSNYISYYLSENASEHLDEEYEEGLGPLIFSYNTYGSLPSTYGMLLKRVCTFDSNTDSAYFTFATDSGLTKSGMKVYLYIK